MTEQPQEAKACIVCQKEFKPLWDSHILCGDRECTDACISGYAASKDEYLRGVEQGKRGMEKRIEELLIDLPSCDMGCAGDLLRKLSSLKSLEK